MNKTLEEQRTEEFIRQTDLMAERLKQYKKSDKKVVADVRYELFFFVRLVNRAKGKCNENIMHEQAKKVIREFKRFGDLIPAIKESMPDIPPEGKDGER